MDTQSTDGTDPKVTPRDKKDTNEKSGPRVKRHSMADRVFALFNGAEIEGTVHRSGQAALAHALKVIGAPYTRSAIYKWNWSRARQGTAGIIPSRAVPWVEKAARAFGIAIPPGTLDPRADVVRTAQGKAMLE